MYFKNQRLKLFIPILIVLSVISCGKAHRQREKKTKIPVQKVIKGSGTTTIVCEGCRRCHPVTLDTNHTKTCVVCHNGNSLATTKDKAHTGMHIAPASPRQMQDKCAKCHPEIVAGVAKSSHFTLYKAVNMVRQAFGAQKISSLLKIPAVNKPSTPLELADDLLRRRCLRCHPYYQGDPYPATRHGTGCAACHIAYENGKPASHKFIMPGDTQCLNCHYGNFVGADYYGRFEHDFNWEYRSPFAPNDDDLQVRPYGIRFHQLTPDIHQRHGMSCIDCHSGQELMGIGNVKITCRVCHFYKITGSHPGNLQFSDGKLWLNTVKGEKIAVPQAVNPAHKLKKAACQVCHALWSYNDQGTYLLRQDTNDFEEWFALTRQGDFEVEKELEANIFFNDDSGDAHMTDKISGQDKPGIWLKSYRLRRWEPVQICRDKNGILQVCRNILDLHLSYVNEDDKVIFDNAVPDQNSNRPQPYTPHTTGKAGVFFKQRLHPK